jgi:hypothetical protein
MTKSRRMKKGGFWDSVTSGWNSVSKGASDSFNSVSESATSLWSPKKTTTTTYSTTTPSTTTTTPSTTSPITSTTPSTTTGGYRKKSRRMRGGCYGHNYNSNLAATAAPVSDMRTAQAGWVGGKRKSKTRRHRKKRSHRRH